MLFSWRREPAAGSCRNSNGLDKDGGQGRAKREIGWGPCAEPAESLCVGGSKMHVSSSCWAWDTGMDQTQSLPSRSL